MIDLDRPAQSRTPPGGRLRFATVRALILVVAGVFLAGAVVGGATMYFWRYQPLATSVAAEESTVAVLLFAEPGPVTVHHDERRVSIDAQVTVVNAGPEPINVLSVRVDQPGVTVRSPEKDRGIEPGTALPLDVVVEWDCTADQSKALVVSVRMETADEQLRTLSPVPLDDTPWTASRHNGCADLR